MVRSTSAQVAQPSRRRAAQQITCEVGQWSAWLWGPHAWIQRALDVTGAPSMRCPKRRTVTVPIGFVDDVLAHLEHAQRRRIAMRISEGP